MGNSKLRLNRERKKFLGVCAGIADYLEVEPWTVRLVFVVAFLLGAWFLVPLYFGFYFFLDHGGALRDNATIKHLRNVDYRKKLYRNKREGKFLGVCAGIADYFEVDVTLVRIIVLVLLFVAGPIPWLAYFGAWFVLDPKPDPRDARAPHTRGRFSPRASRRNFGFGASGTGHDRHGDGEAVFRHDDGEAVFPNSDGESVFRQGDGEAAFRSQRRDIRHCVRKFSILEDRLARIEAYVTSPQFKLHREFKNMV